MGRSYLGGSVPVAVTVMTEDELYERIATILDAARGQVARTVNTAMVHAYWRIGREIVLVEQGGAARAGYGERLLEQISRRLTARYGRGFGVGTIRRARAYFLAFRMVRRFQRFDQQRGRNLGPRFDQQR